MSEIEMLEDQTIRVIETIAKDEEDKVYRQGLSDYVAGRRETVEAQYYVSYWSTRSAIGETAIQPLAE